MAGKRLLDTSAMVELIRGADEVLERVGEHEISVSLVVIAELYYGAYGRENRAKRVAELQDLLSECEVLLHSLETSKIYAEMKRTQRGLGKKIPDNDMWIAASAREHDLVLAHRDKHFETVEGLQQERW